jgi:glycosyltransferase involved in cell wall biosynthesis
MRTEASPGAAPVAIIIPCYNYGRFIGQTIQTVLAQSLKPSEVIIVDDGSTDNTAEVVRSHPGVQYVWKPNGGPSSARNEGYRRSSAEYIMFPDADDVLRPDGLEILFSAMRSVAPEVPVVFGRSETFTDTPGDSGEADESTKYLPLPQDVLPYVSRKLSDDLGILSRGVLERLLRGNIVPQCSALIHRSVYDAIGLWDEQFLYHQDRDMWLRIASRFPIAYVDRTVSLVRRHGDNITHGKNWVRNHFEILDLLDKAVKGDWADAQLHRMARRRYAVSAYNLGGRLAEAGDYARATGVMARSWKADPLGWKAPLRMVGYSLRWLAGGRPKD